MKKIIAIPVMCSVMLTGCGQADIPDNTPDTQIVTMAKETETADTENKQVNTTVAGSTSNKAKVTSSDMVSSGTKATTISTSSQENKSNNSVVTTISSNNSSLNGNNNHDRADISQTGSQKQDVSQNKVTQKPAEIQTTVLSQIKTASTTKTVTTRQITTVTTATTAPPPQPTEPPTPKPQILDYDRLDDQMQTFIDGYDIDYNWLYEKGANLTHDGTDYGKAVAICNETEAMGGINCINYAINAYFMSKGAGLECYIARSSDYGWYGHVANIIKLDDKYYYMEPMGDVVGAPTTCPSGDLPYPNGLDIVTDIYDNRINVTVENNWYR